MGLIKWVNVGVKYARTTTTASTALWIELHPFLEHFLLVLFAETSTRVRNRHN